MMELTISLSQTNHVSNGEENGGGAAVIRETFHILTNTLLSLLLPLSFLLLARLATANYFQSASDNYPTQNPTYLLCSLFLNKRLTILHLLVSVISAATLAQGLTGKTTFLSQPFLTRHRLYAAWTLLCVLQLCVGLGIEGSIAAGVEGSSLGQEKGLLCRVLFFLGLHETTRFWWRTVVKPVVDDTVLGVYREEEGWVVKLVIGVGFGWLWWWRVREEVEALALAAEMRRELMMGIGVADFVGWWLYYITVTVGMVRVVKGLIGVWMFLVCNRRRKPTPNDEKV
ncbi:uncharacterized protein LOC142541754 [Primulina tabacum]|uniref:uncharacterized protein LOC142541754 n=1 Tax=Primulina tabacum TaxID=48773 RepID=UPI003F5932B5